MTNTQKKELFELTTVSISDMIKNKEFNKEYLKSIQIYYKNWLENYKKELFNLLELNKIDKIALLKAKEVVVLSYLRRTSEYSKLRNCLINYLMYKAYYCWVKKIISTFWDVDMLINILNNLSKANEILKSTVDRKNVDKFIYWFNFIEKEFYENIKETCSEK